MRFPPNMPSLFALSTSPWAAMPDFIQGRPPRTYPLTLSDTARLLHLYAIGKTGSGKSTLLETLMRQDLERGHGFAFLDPHGDLAERMLARVPAWRRRHVIYFNPADLEYPTPLNVLAGVERDRRHLVASALVSTFKRFWPDAWGPRTEHLLRNAAFALLELDGATLLDVPRLLSDEAFRARVIARVRDAAVRDFWAREFAAYPPAFRAEVIAPLQNKLSAFLVTPPLRNIVAQRTNLFDLREIMDRGHVLIANLSKGRLGEDTSSLVGSLLLTRFLLATLGRADTPEPERRPFFVYIDEFPSFMAPSTLAAFLSESRKYGVALALAHQHLSQVPDELRGALFGNVGTLALFGVSAEDADYLAQEVAAIFTRDHLTALEPHRFIVRFPNDTPATAKTLPPPPVPENGGMYTAHVVRHTRRHYARTRRLIERRVVHY